MFPFAETKISPGGSLLALEFVHFINFKLIRRFLVTFESGDIKCRGGAL